MNDNKNANTKTKALLCKIFGIICLILGLGLFFSPIISMGNAAPGLFSLSAVGAILFFVGSVLLNLSKKYSHAGSASQNDSSPRVDIPTPENIINDDRNRMAPGCIVCPKCGRLNNPGSRFCDQCGARLLKVCPKCGHENDATDVYCAKCGTKLDEKQ